MAKQWLKDAITKKGALHKDLGVPEGQKIPKAREEAAAHGDGKTAQRARLALQMRGFKK